MAFRTLLIANRGEIACRIAATARRMGIRTAAVYSDADAGASHVAACDEALRVGAAPSSESYLNVGALLAAARSVGAQAVHPGYGFLSENAAFAEACEAAGLVFVGPPAAAIRAMGDKREAKRLMRAAGVPLIPGVEETDGAPAAAADLMAQAAAIGYPVLIKAALGGGGRGIRVVERDEDFAAALAACRREAMAAFADDRVLLERYLPSTRHIEVQVFADRHGGCLYLHERDCSAQRRHQKVVEEAPAPGLPPALRRQLGEAAVAAARAVGYRGAGTVEFLLDPAGRHYFMEMNTRLQVEHPVTEMITGLDLVEWQLRVAAGEPLPLAQDEVACRGHAFEARIYAEDPEREFLPSTGVIRHLALPGHAAFTAQGAGAEPAPVRIDGALRAADEVTPFYDAMVAKLIAWGADRTEALGVLQSALSQVKLVGPASNLDFLQRLAGHADFAAGGVDTGWIGRHLGAGPESLIAPDPQGLALRLAAACAAVMALERTGHGPGAAAAGWADPWTHREGWRLNGTGWRSLALRSAGRQYDLRIDFLRSGMRLHAPGIDAGLQVESWSAPHLTLRFDGETVHAEVHEDGGALHVYAQGRHQRFATVDPLAGAAMDDAGEDRLCAPMPGKVIAVHAAAGQGVRRGQVLVVMEAMKMEHSIVAPHDGVVEELRYRVGDAVAEGAPLVKLAAPGAGVTPAKGGT